MPGGQPGGGGGGMGTHGIDSHITITTFILLMFHLRQFHF